MNPQVRLPDAWSYSAYAMYEQCPHRYHGEKVLKMQQPPSDALDGGRKFHVQVAEHITQPDAPLPERPIHAKILPIVAQLRTMPDKVVEQQWGFNTGWKPTGWMTFHPPVRKVWLRAILDVGLVYEDRTGLAGDWKTGKRYSNNDDQMELFSAVTLSYFPHLDEVETRLWYVDTGDEEVAQFKRSELPALQEKWNARAQVMLADRTWTPKPNDKCRFCVRSREAGGDCRFG